MKEKLIAQMIVTSFLKELQGRKGFDHWFHDIDDETQEEINDELVKIATDLMIKHRNLL